jgi:secreted trypsin-like serine protease
MDANTTFTPATLPEDDVLSQINPDNCYAASFGNVIVRETVSDGDKITRTKAKNMHVVQLPIMNKKSDSYCPMQFIPYGSTPTSMNYQRKIISKFFCAGNQTQGVDIKTATPCSDEMGTPLICKVGNKNVVTGILAVAPDCESQESPTYQPVLFTSIAKQLDYIKSVMASMPY